jgi:type IV secretion system protein TrbL
MYISAQAAETMDPSSAVSIVMESMAPAVSILQTNAWKWLSVLMLLQLVYTNSKSLISGGEIDNVWAKFLGSMFWFGMCFYITENGPSFINNVGNQLFNLVGDGLPNPGSIMSNTTAMSASLAVVAAAVGFFNGTAGQLVLYLMLVVLFIGIFFSIKILMIQLELVLIVLLSPLSFSLLGLNALKDQGIAPLKSLISLGYRIILTSIILSAFYKVDGVVGNIINNISVSDIAADGVGKVISSLVGGLGAYILLAALLWKSDSIASGLASGGTSMGAADMASSVAAGVAGGMAAHAAAGAATTAAGNGQSAVSDMIKGLRSQAASVTNASGNGTGGFSPGPSAGNGSFSLGDAPKGPAKSPNYSTKDIQQMAKDKGLPPVGGAKPSSSGTNPTTASSSNASPSASSGNNTAGSNAASSAKDMGLGSAPSGMRYTNTEPAPNENSQSSPLGNANNASISGESGTSGSGLEKQLEALVDQLSKQGQSKPSAKERLGSLNNQIERESAATHVSINTHNSD